MNDITTVPEVSVQNGNNNGTKSTEPQFNIANAEIAVVSSGLATKYWLELKAYPTGTARSLWLLVSSSWKRYDNPNQVMSDCVQRAFLGTGTNVRVWYDGGVIKGLVVEGN